MALIARDFRVKLLCRGRRDLRAVERVRRTLAWHGLRLDDRVEVIEGDVCEPRFGLTAAQFAEHAGSTTEIIHCASSTSFSDKKRLEIEQTNIEGTRHCLEFARAGRIAHFHYISTAFAAGKLTRTCPEALVEPPGYHNQYEASKNVAEHMVADECGAAQIGWTIYRPSVIIGEDVDFVHGPANFLYFLQPTGEKLPIRYKPSQFGEHGLLLAIDGLPATLSERIDCTDTPLEGYVKDTRP